MWPAKEAFFVPKQIRFKSQTSAGGKETALQIYCDHDILSDNKYLSYCTFKQEGLYEYVWSVACKLYLGQEELAYY